MTEIQRLKETGRLSDDGPGPRGSLTISDIRLPLKKDFVTKIGTSHGTVIFFYQHTVLFFFVFFYIVSLKR